MRRGRTEARVVAALALSLGLAGCGADAPGFRAAAEGAAAACPARMVRVPGTDACIDRLEAVVVDGRAMPAVDVAPSSALSFDEAARACRAAGFRLCTGREWGLACGGTEDRRYPYGNSYEVGRCNTAEPTSDLAAIHVQPSGRFPGCASPEGVLDLSGNVGEWTDEPDATGTLRELRGGAARNGESNVRCVLDDRGFQPPSSAFEGQGVRCCADLGG